MLVRSGRVRTTDQPEGRQVVRVGVLQESGQGHLEDAAQVDELVSGHSSPSGLDVADLGHAPAEAFGQVGLSPSAARARLASGKYFVYRFDYAGDPDAIVIDMTNARIWDASSVAAMDAITAKYRARGKQAQIIGLDAH